MERHRYLVAYDIRNERRLRRVHGAVVDFGERLQYSVYVCDLTKVELTDLRRAVRAEMNLSIDALSIFDLGPPNGPVVGRIEHLGVALHPDNRTLG